METDRLKLQLLEQSNVDTAALYNTNLQILEAIALKIIFNTITATSGATSLYRLYLMDNATDADHNNLIIRINVNTVRVIPPTNGMRFINIGDNREYTYLNNTWTSVAL